MRIGEMKQELESYGISTKLFLEKNEFVKAIEAARAEGKKATKPKKEQTKTVSEDKKSRKIRLEEEIENCKSMKVPDLKKELASYGISTKSFFEKSEFVKACAKARVDGIKDSNTKKQEEQYDPTYRDVKMKKMGSATQMLDGRSIIDVRLG